MTLASFRARVLAVVRRIPPGRVATYGDVAELAGRPRAWRAVGNIMRGCRDGPRTRTVQPALAGRVAPRPDPATPCHRVVGAAGALGGYGGTVASALQLKRELLRAEGIDVSATRIRRFREIRWAPKVSKVR